MTLPSEVAALRELQGDAQSLTGSAALAYGEVLSRLDALDALRERAFTADTAVDLVIGRYSEVISALLNFNRSAFAGARSESTDLPVGISSIADAKEQLSVQHAVLLSASLTAEISPTQVSQLRITEAAFDFKIRDYAAAVPVAERQFTFNTFRGTAIADRERMLQVGLGEGPSAVPLGSISASWDEAANGVQDILLTIERSLSDDLLTATERASSTAIADTIRDASIVALLLMFTLVVLVLVARSVLRPLLALRTSALDVAQRRLPELVEQLRRPGGWKGDVTPQPMVEDTGEDIGQVARAFDEVHREAVRLATEQAMMRSTVNDMFVNLSRRSQGMVERQLRIIDDLESGERDPEVLGVLFRLDHLATRMRRNSENLLVLAGSETRRRTGSSRPVLDVLRGAISEIEDYQRITIESVPDVAVSGIAVSDLVHLTAELLDNATNFSPTEEQVILASSIEPDGGLLIEIRDAGVGMSVRQRNAINSRLAVPPMVDVSVSRHMGLFVVGRLAARHGISVRVAGNRTISGSEQGLTAVVSVPSRLISVDAEAPAPATPVGSAEVGSDVTTGVSARSAIVPASTEGPDPAANGGFGLDMSPADALFDGHPTDFFASLPAADSSSQGPGEGTPIFHALRSAWFREGAAHPGLADEQADDTNHGGAAPAGSDEPAQSRDPAEVLPDFGSVADEGWQAVEQLLTLVDAGTTRAGLPRRQPRAHLVPGGTSRAADPGVSADGQQPAVGRSNNLTLLRDAERVRGNLSSYQRGTRRGRHSAPAEASAGSVADQAPDEVGRHGDFPTSGERQ